MPHTLTTPEPPSDRIGTIMSSLPESMQKSSFSRFATLAAKEMLPLASLMPLMLGSFASSAMQSSDRLQPVREGTLYRRIGRFTCSATVAKWRYMPFWLALL